VALKIIKVNVTVSVPELADGFMGQMAYGRIFVLSIDGLQESGVELTAPRSGLVVP
jgi:hypothetical protein